MDQFSFARSERSGMNEGAKKRNGGYLKCWKKIIGRTDFRIIDFIYDSKQSLLCPFDPLFFIPLLLAKENENPHPLPQVLTKFVNLKVAQLAYK